MRILAETGILREFCVYVSIQAQKDMKGNLILSSGN